MSILIKSVMEDRGPHDGVRVLVDEHMPAGMDEYMGDVDLWPKELSPSERLCRMHKERPELWDQFLKEYFKELHAVRETWIKKLIGLARKGNLTLLYSCGDASHNVALAIKKYIIRTLAEEAEDKAA